ncbi:isoprenoid biosynthesis glyoxalase ElbB [Corallincola luteus]|uniref:Glyoxalase n=1 Tax=Corallincola luteus TaxID=1775177 RepID=A0ABY2AMI2_9GAMM|nr:isoprenoid biosynthesis glyoxalase ElbB [Corallincola luteus]TCI04406.1 isoprenoid biosynthesis glyoxalase ElbB [Corallincola luteus]
MKKVAVILSGSGVFDGAEIHETVISLLALSRAGAEYQCFAPNITQHHVVNHLTGEVAETEQRNVLVEAARIARGEIQDVAQLNAADFDALLLPGGFGAAKNLSDFAFKGAECQIDANVLKACQAFATAGKAAAYLCISPILIPQVYGHGAKGTIGTDSETAKAFNQLGGEHQACAVTEICVDQERKVISTPAYMLAENITEAAVGIEKAVDQLLAMA